MTEPTPLFVAMKLRHYCEKFGFQLNADLSVRELLALAVESDDTCRSLDAFDPARQKFAQDAQDYFNFALALEQHRALLSKQKETNHDLAPR